MKPMIFWLMLIISNANRRMIQGVLLMITVIVIFPAIMKDEYYTVIGVLLIGLFGFYLGFDEIREVVRRQKQIDKRNKNISDLYNSSKIEIDRKAQLYDEMENKGRKL